MSDVSALAHDDVGLSCFAVPRWTPAGTPNGMNIQRLKSKLGNRSNASSEIEYEEAYAFRVGDPGRGVRTIIDMVAHTRLDCVVASAGLMHFAVAQAVNHARHRKTFGKRLVEHRLMTNVLADLALESEAALVLGMRLAHAYENSGEDEAEGAFARIATAIGKYWVCKRVPAVAYEAMECFGGNGYVEDSPMARLYREAPLNSIWEGSGNVICLDVLRAMVREPGAIDALRKELRAGHGYDSHYDQFVGQVESALSDGADLEVRARWMNGSQLDSSRNSFSLETQTLRRRSFARVWPENAQGVLAHCPLILTINTLSIEQRLHSGRTAEKDPRRNTGQNINGRRCSMGGEIWVNGVLNGAVPGDDPGILLGLTVFETLRTYDGHPFRLEQHMERLVASIKALEIDAPPRRQIEQEILSVCEGNVSIRYTLTGGGCRILQRKPIDSSRIGRHMKVARMAWQNPVSLPGAVKHGCRAAWVLAARKSGADEVLLIDPSGCILEASRSNVFAVLNGVMCTPPLDGRQLAGVTREAILEAAERAGIAIKETSIAHDAPFEELYLASTLKELAPVVSIDGQPCVGAGPLGARLHAAFRELVWSDVSS